MFWRTKTPKTSSATAATSRSAAAPPAAAEPEAAAVRDFQTMVDEMPINVMTCSLEDFTIDYANKATLKTLREIEHALPIKADELLGDRKSVV